MNDISVILSKIGADASAQAAAITDAAQQNCQKIKADYDKQAQAEREKILAAADAACEAVRLRAASQSGIEGRNINLEARRRIIDATFEKAMERLCAMSDEQKVAFYSAQILRFISCKADLILNASEKASIGKAVSSMVAKQLVADGIDSVVDALTGLKLPSESIGRVIMLSEESGHFRGGFQLREGSIETNCTFEVLVSGAKEELEPEVARLLFS
ncbi:MAG: V-type ATP synthase subunit E [Angelakisella sp.]